MAEIISHNRMNSTERSAGGALAKSRCALLAALAVIGIAHWSWEALPHSKKLADVRVPRELSVSMLDGEVILIGRLGLPLGTACQISGVWEPRVVGPKESEWLHFVVHELNHRPLLRPIEFHEFRVEKSPWQTGLGAPALIKEAGAKWTYECYESLEFEGTPCEMWPRDGPIPGGMRELHSNSTIIVYDERQSW
jgi:hypothetical protein